MGVLDSVFGGDSGVVSTLSRTLGGTAVVKIATNSIEEKTTGKIVYEYKNYEVPFIPSDAGQKNNNQNSGVQRIENTRSGSFPVTDEMKQDGAEPRILRDYIVIDGLKFRFDSLDKTCVGNTVVQYTFSATR